MFVFDGIASHWWTRKTKVSPFGENLRLQFAHTSAFDSVGLFMTKLYFTAVDQQAISFKTVEYTGEFEPTTYTYTDYL